MTNFVIRTCSITLNVMYVYVQHASAVPELLPQSKMQSLKYYTQHESTLGDPNETSITLLVCER